MKRWNALSTSLTTSILSASLLALAASCAGELDEAGENGELRDEARPAELDEARQAARGEQGLAAGPAALVRAARAIPGQYVVVLKKSELAARSEKSAEVSAALARSVGAKLVAQYEHALAGFAARMSEAEAKALLADPRVAYVAEDGLVEASATQTGATWGLDRIDQKDRPTNGNYSYHTSGGGVHAYIIDTGMRLTHSEYAGRVGNGFDAVSPGGNANDCNGHGTHVAGTVGGTTYGVAKSVTLHPVRVLDCGGSGSFAGVIAGIDWVTANHIKPAVANMSLGGGAYQPVDDAVTNSIAAGVTYAIAAGNSNADACSSSPARTPNALTVGATDANDARASFSNYGTCVDLFAPGVGITSSYSSGDAATAVLSGTSMASPHVAGVAALYLSRVPSATPAQVAAKLFASSVAGQVSNPGGGSPNRLLHNGLFNVSLRALSGHYLVAEGGGGSFVGADRTAAGNWERFDLADLNGGALGNGDFVNLRASSGSYLVAEGGGGGVLNADRPIAAGWEGFKLVNLSGAAGFTSGDVVALQGANGQYVVAENGGGSTGAGSVNVNRDAIGAWEQFVITFY